MSATYVAFDASMPHGGTLSTAVDYLLQGRALLNRFYEAANAATDAGSNKDALIGGDFGAVDSAAAALMWQQAYTIKTLLDGDDAGGLTLALGSLDKGAAA